jgi:hypothetical protein
VAQREKLEMRELMEALRRATSANGFECGLVTSIVGVVFLVARNNGGSLW